jgi:hypothetical protein
MLIHYSLKAKPKGEVKVQVYAGSMLLNELSGPAEAGINTVFWNMTGRRERTPEEKKAAQEGTRRLREMGYGGMGGDPNFASFPVQPGEYRFVLTVDGKTTAVFASVLRDPRFQ